jgi:hypothetical protein
MNENFVFQVFSKSQTEELTSSPDIREVIRKVLKLSEDEKSEILIDFYSNLCRFCIKQDFTLEKLSCTLGIANHILKNSISVSVPVSISSELLKKLLKKHSIQRPPFSVKVFSTEETKLIEDFIQENYFKNYALYSYGFTPHKDVIITTEKLYCANFPTSLTLAEGVEVSAESILELQEYLPRKISTPEFKNDVKPKEMENDTQEDLDPVQTLLNNEMKAFKSLIEEKMKRQDDEIFSKIEILKK